MLYILQLNGNLFDARSSATNSTKEISNNEHTTPVLQGCKANNHMLLTNTTVKCDSSAIWVSTTNIVKKH